LAGAATLVLALGLAAGCKKEHAAGQQAARTDQQVAGDIQTKLQGETSLAGIDSGNVDGVRTVVNNLTVQPAQQSSATPPPPLVKEKRAKPDARKLQEQAEAAPPQQPAPVPEPAPVQAAASAPPPPPPPPPAPPEPVVKQLTLDAGT